MTEEDLRKLAALIWLKMKENPDPFRGVPGEPGERGPEGPPGSLQKTLRIQFANGKGEIVGQLTQLVDLSEELPTIVIPPVKLKLRNPQATDQTVTVGDALSIPIEIAPLSR